MKFLIAAILLTHGYAFATEYKIPNLVINTSDFQILEEDHSPNPVKISKDGNCKLEKIVDIDTGSTTIYITDKSLNFFESIHFSQDGRDLDFMAVDFSRPKMCDFDIFEVRNGNYKFSNKCKHGLKFENLDIELDNDGLIASLDLKKQRFGAGHSLPIPVLNSSSISCKF